MKPYLKIAALCIIWGGASIFSRGVPVWQPSGFSLVAQVLAADETQETQDKVSEQQAGAKSDSKENEKKTDKDGKSPCPECPECPDPAKVVLRGLEEKRTMVEKAHESMIAEKKQLEIFEQQIDEKLENLNALEKQIKADMALLDQKKSQKELDQEAAYEAKIGRLVKMYAGMKPKDAAAIVNTLNLEVAQEIFLRMREASASQILSSVDSEKAAKISERLAFKRK